MQDNSELHQALARRMQNALQSALKHERPSMDKAQDEQSLDSVQLELLKLQLEEAQTERDAARSAFNRVIQQRDRVQREVDALKASLEKATARHESSSLPSEFESSRNPVFKNTARGPWSHASAAIVSGFVLSVLVTGFVFHDAQSTVKEPVQVPVSQFVEKPVQPLIDLPPLVADKKKPPPRTDEEDKDTLFARVKPASSKQWGPSLLMADPAAVKPRVVFDAQVKQQQKNLLTLGFDIGKADGFKGLRTRQAIEEFYALYLNDPASRPQGADLTAIISNYAALARRDAGRFGIDHGVVAAIRLSSVRTGIDFAYLMKLAATESNFEPAVKSATSSATGLYQFTRNTWLNVIKQHGDKYGLGDYVNDIEYYVTRSGYRRPMVRNKAVYKHLLALRKNPRLSAMMAAESVRDNQQRLVYSLEREPTQADLYLTHFLGTDGAITFLKSLQHNPDVFAVELFPEAAGSNRDIFHPQSCDPRTVDEVYTLFGEKFSSQRFDDLAAN